jgi:transposase
MAPDDSIPDDIDALRAELVVERTARRGAEARAIGAEAMVTHLKFMIRQA